LNAWEPGRQSKIYPQAPAGLLFPGDSGVPAGIAPVDHHEFMPRVGLAWDPFGDSKTTVRAGYGIFYDGFTNGTGGPLQASVSALPWTEAYQLPGPGFDIANPFGKAGPPFANLNFVTPATVLTVQSGMVPPYSQNWNFSIERAIAKDYLLDIRYVGNKGTHLPRFIEANPVVFGPGVNANNNNQKRQYTTCNAAGICNYGSVGLLADDSSSTYHALEVAFSRQFSHGLSFLASYWFSKTLDYKLLLRSCKLMGAFVISPLPPLFVELLPTAGLLRSTDITPLHCYYEPLRDPLVFPPLSWIPSYTASLFRRFLDGTRRASPVA
jgi:hypothetical protein